MSDGQREALEVLTRSQTAPHRQVLRAEALVLAGEGIANAQIAQRLGVKAATVRAWRARFAEDGLAKLGKVRAGRGRKSTIPQSKIDEIVELTRHSKPAGPELKAQWVNPQTRAFPQGLPAELTAQQPEPVT